MGDPFDFAGADHRPACLQIIMQGCEIRVLGLRDSVGLEEILRMAARQVERQHQTMGYVICGKPARG